MAGPLSPIDAGSDAPAGRAPANPRREHVVAGPWGGLGQTQRGGYLVAQAIDDVVSQFGPWVYELMRLDPAISGSLNLLFAGILAEGLQVSPAEVAEPGEIVSRRKRRRDLKLAEEVADFWRDGFAKIQPGIDQVLWELLDEATTGGCTAAEPVYELAEDGPWRGKLVLKNFQVKPRWAWGLRVDPYMRVKQLRCWTVDGWADVDRQHFVLLAWQPRCGDPRGTRLLRPAYPAWNFKLQAIPDYSEYLKHFADPSLILTGGDDMRDLDYVDETTGVRVRKTVQQQLVEAGLDFKSRSILGLPKGSTATLLQSVGNGEPYLKGFDWSDREMFRTIILGARPMAEAKHSSKADAESGLDMVQMAVQAGRRPLAEAVRRDLLWTGTMLNWGRPVADQFTPKVSFGLSDHLTPYLMDSMANAWDKGLFGPTQRPWLLDKLGAPQDAAPDEADPGQPPDGPRDPAEPDSNPPADPPQNKPAKPTRKPKGA